VVKEGNVLKRGTPQTHIHKKGVGRKEEKNVLISNGKGLRGQKAFQAREWEVLVQSVPRE